MKILVTGGAGFIGHHVVEKLQWLGHDVFVLDDLTTYGVVPENIHQALMLERTANFKNPLYKLHIDDKVVKDIIRAIQPEMIIHLASFPRAKIVNANPNLGAITMIDGLFNLLDASMLANLKKFVYISSSMVYGNFEGGITEDAECKPGSIYAAFKYSGELITIRAAQQHGFEYTIVRPSAVYGPRDVEDRVVSKLILNAIRGGVLNVNGINERLDFSYVDDTADGIILAAFNNKANGEIFNITRGEDRTIHEAAQIITSMVGQGEINIREKDPTMPSRGYLDISKAKDLLGFSPTINIEEGFKKYYEWINSSVFCTRSSIRLVKG